MDMVYKRFLALVFLVAAFFANQIRAMEDAKLSISEESESNTRLALELLSASQQVQNYQEATVNLTEELLDDKEHFKDSQALIVFLEQTASEGKISENFKFIKYACELSEELRISGFWSAQLFLVICENGSQYVIKEIKQYDRIKDEINNLQTASKDSRMQKFIYPNETNNLQFIFPLSYLSCFSKNQEHNLVIMPKAQGKSLLKKMLKFGMSSDASNKIIAFIGAAHFDLGWTMAKFYKDQGTLDSTVVHGDLHNGNIFYDPKFRLIILIDNELVNVALRKPCDISIDLGTLFVASPFFISFTFKDFFEKINLERWYTIVLTSFMFGFMSTYEQPERLDVFIKLKDLLFKWNSWMSKDKIEKVTKVITEILINNLAFQYSEQRKTELEIVKENPDLEILEYLISIK